MTNCLIGYSSANQVVFCAPLLVFYSCCLVLLLEFSEPAVILGAAGCRLPFVLFCQENYKC
jgi:hypothetical protein